MQIFKVSEQKNDHEQANQICRCHGPEWNSQCHSNGNERRCSRKKQKQCDTILRQMVIQSSNSGCCSTCLLTSAQWWCCKCWGCVFVLCAPMCCCFVMGRAYVVCCYVLLLFFMSSLATCLTARGPPSELRAPFVPFVSTCGMTTWPANKTPAGTWPPCFSWLSLLSLHS